MFADCHSKNGGICDWCLLRVVKQVVAWSLRQRFGDATVGSTISRLSRKLGWAALYPVFCSVDTESEGSE
jgi:hypothetical protein